MNNKDILLAFGLEIQKQTIANHIAAGQKATGDTIESFQVEATETRMIFSGAEYVSVLETGRKPGSAPPVSAIEKWIIAKGIKPKKGNTRSLAFAISKNIGRMGTNLFQKQGRKDIFSNVITDERINSLGFSLKSRFANLIEEEILQQFER